MGFSFKGSRFRVRVYFRARAFRATSRVQGFFRAMATRLDRLMHVQRKPSNKRVCADSTVSASEVQGCLTTHLRDRNTTDLWSCIVPGPDGPRTWSFRKSPDGRWMARFAALAFDLVSDVCRNSKILSRVMIPAIQACVLNGVVTNNSGQDEAKFTASVDVTIRILLSWYRQLKVCKKKRETAFRRLSEAEKTKVAMVMDKIELNEDEVAEAADEGGSESEVDLTFMVSLDSLGTTNTAEDDGSAALHRMFDNVLTSPSTDPPSGGPPSGSAPSGDGASSVALSNLELIALARSRKPAFMATKTASGSKPRAKTKAKAKGKAKATAMVKTKPKLKAVPKKPAAAVPKKPVAAVAKAVPGQAEQIFTAPDGAQFMFMMYGKGLPTERIAICEWLGTKRGCQLLQVSSKGLASEARAVIAGELMDMLVAGKSLEDLKARKLELLSAV